MPLEYFNTRGTSGEHTDQEDNPLSPSFVPPRARSTNSAARWWALEAKKFKQRSVSQSSYEKVVDSDDDL